MTSVLRGSCEGITAPILRQPIETPAEEIAAAEASFFPDTDPAVLTRTIDAYQKLGCWTPHIEITPAAYEVTLDVFEHVGRLSKRYPYEAVCAAPPTDD